MIPGAVSLKKFSSNASNYKGFPIVVYCTIGWRSAQMTSKLRKKGFNAHNLKGSILSWVNQGNEVVNQAGKTKKVHVYGSEWNILPHDYEGVW